MAIIFLLSNMMTHTFPGQKNSPFIEIIIFDVYSNYCFNYLLIRLWFKDLKHLKQGTDYRDYRVSMNLKFTKQINPSEKVFQNLKLVWTSLGLVNCIVLVVILYRVMCICLVILNFRVMFICSCSKLQFGNIDSVMVASLLES